MRVLVARVLEGELITGIALVDVDDPERHPAMGVRHLWECAACGYAFETTVSSEAVAA